jgi:F-type H+-transporting ATPase subunit gamma
MPSLKDLRMRIASVKSTRKITSAMKMVAASKLRRAQTAAEAARPYAERMERMLSALAGSMAGQTGGSRLLTGTGKDDVHLIVVATADRGLCGGFNSNIIRDSRRMIVELQRQGKTVKLLMVGRKGRDVMRREHGRLFVETFEGLGRRSLAFAEVNQVAEKILALFDEGAYDVCTIIYNRFRSAISQEVTRRQMVPFPLPAASDQPVQSGSQALYEFEPSEEGILEELLPRNVAIQIYRALLENAASEQGARMTAMDNATRNAGDMLNRLTMRYNRTRQAQITKELIEIISGAEAL